MASLHGLIRKTYGKLYAERLVLDGDRDATPDYAPLGLFPSGEPANAAEGALYWSDANGCLMQYTGSAWEAVGATQPGAFTAAGAIQGLQKLEVVTAATRAVTSADRGTHFVLSRAGGIDVALPAVGASDVGLGFRFSIGLAASSDTYTITAQSADLLTGRVLVQDTDTANTITSFAPDGSDDLILTFSDTADLPGSFVDIVCVSATAWYVTGIIYHTGNSATPFS